MKLVKNTESYSEEIIRKNIFKQKLFTIIFLSLSIVALVYCIKYSAPIDQNSVVIFTLMTMGLLFGLLLKWMTGRINSFFFKTDQKIGISSKGHEGEEIVSLEMKNILDEKYTVYQNFKIPGRKFDIDFLIVGPKGVIAMEVKNYSDRLLFFEDKIIKVRGEGYTRTVTELYGNYDPRNKLKNHCFSLNNYLQTMGLNEIKVRKVLVFINDNNKIEENPGIFIVQGVNKLKSYFASLYTDEKFTTEFCEKINKNIMPS